MTMEKSSRIILHIGGPKTGSTYLQSRLRASQGLLRKHGIYVPVLPLVSQMAGNAKLLPIVLDKNSSLAFQRAFPDIDVHSLEPTWVMRQLLKDWQRDRETLLLSAENCRPHHAHALRNMLPDDASCRVILFIRRQDKWVDSYYNQRVKMQATQESIGSFMSGLLQESKSRICCPDWYMHYSAWSNAFGNCKVVLYDKARSDLCSAFFAAAELNQIPDLPEIARTQVSLDLHQLAYLLQLKPGTEFREFAQRRAASGEASKHLGYQNSYSLLSRIDRACLRDRFQSNNNRLMTVLGWADDSNVLEIAPESPDYCDLPQLYQSQDYMHYRQLADEIYATRNTVSHRFRSWVVLKVNNIRPYSRVKRLLQLVR